MKLMYPALTTASLSLTALPSFASTTAMSELINLTDILTVLFVAVFTIVSALFLVWAEEWAKQKMAGKNAFVFIAVIFAFFLAIAFAGFYVLSGMISSGRFFYTMISAELILNIALVGASAWICMKKYCCEEQRVFIVHVTNLLLPSSTMLYSLSQPWSQFHLFVFGISIFIMFLGMFLTLAAND